MSLSDFQQHALQLARLQQTQAALLVVQALRAQGAEDFSAATWPGRKVEHWKYTSVQSLQSFHEAALTADAESADNEAAVGDAAMAPILASVQATTAYHLVLRDGQLDESVSDALPQGVCLFSQADGAASQVVGQYLGKIAGAVSPERRNLFAALNNAWLDDGLLIHVAANQKLDKPLYLTCLYSGGMQSRMANQRVLIVLETGAEAQVIEHFVSLSEKTEAPRLLNALTEIQLGANARLHHTRINLEDEQHSHLGAVHMNLQRSARAELFTLALGGALKRIDYQINHQGEGADLTFNGIYLARHQQQVDFHTTIEHQVPHCTSQEVFRGIVGNKARAVFNGRIHIHEQAQKTLAELNNRNLLTSNQAEVDTKPELEIYADDVRCAHGATVSQLDETALYYLQSRGIEHSQARMMLSYGFINEVLQTLPHPELLSQLQTYLRQRFIEESHVEPA